MNPVEVLAYFIGIPALVVALLAAWIWSHKGPHPATYKMTDPWTHEPILWTATDELIPGGHGHEHGSSDFTVGGGASGKW
ncbi:MAG: aa3-type cytochrome oxidase subunit CtaJ [Mycobacterium sp.]